MKSKAPQVVSDNLNQEMPFVTIKVLISTEPGILGAVM